MNPYKLNAFEKREKQILTNCEEQYCLVVKDFNSRNASGVFRNALALQKKIKDAVQHEMLSAFGAELLDGIYDRSSALCNDIQLLAPQSQAANEDIEGEWW